MTMSFDVPDEALLAQLAPGQHIDFELEVSDKSFRIVAARSEAARGGASRKPSSGSALGPNDLAPDFSLVDQSGRGVTLADLRGQVLVVDFIFTRCAGPCPILTARNVELQRALDASLRERVRFVSISLDPANDTPEALTAYAAARGADLVNWSFLTGPEADVAEVVRRFGVGTLRAPDGNIDHALATFLVDGRGRIETRWLGLEHPVEQMRSEVAALAAAPAGGVLSAVSGFRPGRGPTRAHARGRARVLRARRLAGAAPRLAHGRPGREERAHRARARRDRRRRARSRRLLLFAAPSCAAASSSRTRSWSGRSSAVTSWARACSRRCAPRERRTALRACSSTAASYRRPTRRRSCRRRRARATSSACAGSRCRSRCATRSPGTREQRRTHFPRFSPDRPGLVAKLNAQLPYALAPVMVQSSEPEAGGVPIGEAARPVSPVDHRGYALTWFAVGALSLAAWVEYGRRRARGQ